MPDEPKPPVRQPMPEDGDVPDGWETRETTSGMWLVPKSVKEGKTGGISITSEGISIGKGTIVAAVGGFISAGGLQIFLNWMRPDVSERYDQFVTKDEFVEWRHKRDLMQLTMQDNIDDTQDDIDDINENIKVILATLDKIRDQGRNP